MKKKPSLRSCIYKFKQEESLNLNFELFHICRFQGEDFEGKMLQEAESIRHKLPLFVPPSYSWGAGTAVRIVVVSCVITLSCYNSCLQTLLYVEE